MMLSKFKVRKDDYLGGIYSRESERPKTLKILTVDGFGRSLSYSLDMRYGSTTSITRLSDNRDRVGNASGETVKKIKTSTLKRN